MLLRNKVNKETKYAGISKLKNNQSQNLFCKCSNVRDLVVREGSPSCSSCHSCPSSPSCLSCRCLVPACPPSSTPTGSPYTPPPTPWAPPPPPTHPPLPTIYSKRPLCCGTLFPSLFLLIASVQSHLHIALAEIPSFLYCTGGNHYNLSILHWRKNKTVYCTGGKIYVSFIFFAVEKTHVSYD